MTGFEALTTGGTDSCEPCPGTRSRYAITDLAWEQATARELAEWARRHWTIENSVHWVRDVTFAEDAHQLRTGHAPAVLAGLRDIVRRTLHKTGWANIAAVASFGVLSESSGGPSCRSVLLQVPLVVTPLPFPEAAANLIAPAQLA